MYVHTSICIYKCTLAHHIYNVCTQPHQTHAAVNFYNFPMIVQIDLGRI